MTPTNRNRLVAVVALALAGGALTFIAVGNLGDNLVYYWSPSQLLTQGEKAIGPTIRLGGMVKKESIVWNAGKTHLDFKVADGKEEDSKWVQVSSDEIPPQMFREGIGVVVEGTYDKSNTFHTTRLMVNHSNEYRPPKAGESQKDWQKSLLDEQPQAAAMPHPPGGPKAAVPAGNEGTQAPAVEEKPAPAEDKGPPGAVAPTADDKAPAAAPADPPANDGTPK